MDLSLLLCRLSYCRGNAPTNLRLAVIQEIICERKMKMRILKVEPGQAPYVKDIPNTLESIQEEVGGGFFEQLYVGNGIILCCNEEGKLNGMEPNRRFDDDIIFGPFFLVGDSGFGDFISLTDKQLARGMEAFVALGQSTGN